MGEDLHHLHQNWRLLREAEYAQQEILLLDGGISEVHSPMLFDLNSIKEGNQQIRKNNTAKEQQELGMQAVSHQEINFFRSEAFVSEQLNSSQTNSLQQSSSENAGFEESFNVNLLKSQRENENKGSVMMARP